MAVILVHVDQDQWNEIAQLTYRLDNLEISEEEYVDSLMMVLGPSLHRRPDPDDEIRILLSPRIQVSLN